MSVHKYVYIIIFCIDIHPLKVDKTRLGNFYICFIQIYKSLLVISAATSAKKGSHHRLGDRNVAPRLQKIIKLFISFAPVFIAHILYRFIVLFIGGLFLEYSLEELFVALELSFVKN